MNINLPFSKYVMLGIIATLWSVTWITLGIMVNTFFFAFLVLNALPLLSLWVMLSDDGKLPSVHFKESKK